MTRRACGREDSRRLGRVGDGATCTERPGARPARGRDQRFGMRRLSAIVDTPRRARAGRSELPPRCSVQRVRPGARSSTRRRASLWPPRAPARPDRGRAARRGPLERHVPDPPRRDRAGAAPAAAPAAAAVRARRAARGAAAARVEGTRRADAARARHVRRRRRDRRAVLRDGEGRGRRHHDARSRPRSTRPSSARRIGEQLIDALVRGPRRRLARLRPGGLRQADRLPGAPAAALRRAVGAQQDARDRRRSTASTAWLARAPCRSPVRRRSSTATTASATRCSRPGAPARLVAIFDWELATIGDPLADVGYLPRRTRSRDGRRARSSRWAPSRRSPGFPTRDELIARYEERSGRSMGDVRWYADARAVEGGDLPRGLLQAAARGHDRRPVLQAARHGRARARRARLDGGPWRLSTPRTALLVDWGGVLTTNLFASFGAFCSDEGLAPETLAQRFRERPRVPRRC